MSSDDCCKNCVEIVKCAEKAANFADSITKSANDIAVASEMMAKDAKSIVNICDDSNDGFLSSVKSYFMKQDNSKIDEEPTPELSTVLQEASGSLKTQKNVERDFEHPKTSTPLVKPSQGQDNAPTVTDGTANDIDDQEGVGVSSENTITGFLSAITGIVSSNKGEMESTPQPKELEPMPIKTIKELEPMPMKTIKELEPMPIKTIKELEPMPYEISKEVSGGPEAIDRIMQTLQESRKAAKEMNKCCSESTEKFTNLIDKAYPDLEFLKKIQDQRKKLLQSLQTMHKLTKSINSVNASMTKFSH